MLPAIISELPSLSEPEFTYYLLPFALSWAQHDDPIRRKSACDVLARMPIEDARQALSRLAHDPDATVRNRAQTALRDRTQQA